MCRLQNDGNLKSIINDIQIMTEAMRVYHGLIILYYHIPQDLQWHIVTLITSMPTADSHLLLPHFKTPNSYVHNVIITPYIY